jgi:ABC-type transport system substrate-binding protein
VENSPGPFTAYTKAIQKVEVVDPYTLRFHYAAPYPLAPNDLSTIYIVSKKAATGASTEDFNSGKAAIGSGRYKLVRYVNGDRIELLRNDNYWGDKPGTTRSRSRSSRTRRRAWRRSCPVTSTPSSSRRPQISRSSSRTPSSR